MLKRQSVPILEFDDDPFAIINPGDGESLPSDAPKGCVLSFMHEATQALIDDGKAIRITELPSTGDPIPLYRIEENGVPLLLINCPIGAPMAASMMEIAGAMGITHFLSCGGAGALDRELHMGQILLPDRALRDEGTSYHYLPPGRFVQADTDMLSAMERSLAEQGIETARAGVWTTDAFFRETRDKVDLRRQEGCRLVDMECAAFMAVAKHRGYRYGALLYAADNLDGEKWDSRGWLAAPMRMDLLKATLRCLADILII